MLRRCSPLVADTSWPRRALGAVAASILSGGLFWREQTKRSVVVPLLWREGAFFLRFRLARSGPGLASKDAASDGAQSSTIADTPGVDYLVVADTGSPFLLVQRCTRSDCPDYCARLGCFNGEGEPSALADTVEVFVSGERRVEWREGGTLSFPGAVAHGETSLSDLVFGVEGGVTGSYGGSGNGVYFGLVRDRAADIRPTFLERTPFVSLGIDLRRAGRETLNLSASRLIKPDEDSLQLVDLRKFGAPVSFYAAIATSVRVGGEVLSMGEPEVRPRRVLCIFDTGTTGASLTKELHFLYWNTARRMAWLREGSFDIARKLEVTFALASGRELTLDMFSGVHPVYGSGLDLVTPVGDVAWAGLGEPYSQAGYRPPPGDRPFEDVAAFDDVAFVGLGFLVGRDVRIDTESGRLAISPRAV